MTKGTRELDCTTLEVDLMATELEALTKEERAWLVADELRWRRADEIARREGVDKTGVYRVIRNLEKTPAQRLGAALRHGRLFSLHTR